MAVAGEEVEEEGVAEEEEEVEEQEEEVEAEEAAPLLSARRPGGEGRPS